MATMAEGTAALGAVSSILTIIELSAILSSLAYKYFSDVKSAREEITTLTKQLGVLHLVLIELHNVVHSSPDLGVSQKLDYHDGPIQGCLSDLKELRDKINPNGAFNRLKWPFQKGEISGFLTRIESHKSLFLLALNTDQT